MSTLGHRSAIVAIADIGSGGVAFSLMKWQRGAPATLIDAERSPLPIEERAQDATMQLLAGRLAGTSETLLKRNTIDRVDKLYVIIRAPWVRSQVLRARTTFEHDIIIRQDMINELSKKALQTDAASATKELYEAGIVRIELNGYATTEAAGKHAHEIQVSVLMSLCSEQFRHSIQTALQKALPHVEPTMRSSVRMFTTVLRERAPGQDRSVIDIGSEGISLVSLRAGIPEETRELAIGMHAMLSRIAPGKAPEETLSLMRMLAREECSTEACAALEASLAKAEPEFVRSFGEVMTASTARPRLPNSLLLISHPDLAHWLSRFFARIDFAQFTDTTQPFDIEELHPEDLSEWVTPAAANTYDVGIAFSSAFVNIENSHA